MVCQCIHGSVLTADARQRLLSAMETIPGQWTVVPDLCGVAARREPWLGTWFEGPAEPRVIVACHSRAVRWLLQWAGMPAAADTTRVLNLREEPVESVVSVLRGLAAPGAEAPTVTTGPSASPRSTPSVTRVADQSDWVPWFPVIDRDRCTNCHQCKNFCPFGVYGTDADGRVEVQNPSHCKTNCPACARLCPQVAIIFAKHNQRPIDGAPVTEADVVQRREAQLDKQLKKDDIHAILARRRAAAARGVRT